MTDPVSPPRPPQAALAETAGAEEAREIELVDAFGKRTFEAYRHTDERRNEVARTRAALLAHMRTEREGRQAAERDAARYRWLKEDADNEDSLHTVFMEMTTDSWDAAIDAALAHSTGGGE